VKSSWAQALAWRLGRQLLDPIGTEPVEEVVRRLAAVQSGEAFATELAVRTRRERSHAGEVTEALRDGRLIKTFAFRGATHLMTPEEGGIYLALRASARMWELPSWQEYYRLAPSDWPSLFEVAHEALAEGPLTLQELVAAIAAPPRFRHLGPILAGNPWSVMKVIAWHGVMSFGPMQGRQARFQRLDRNRRWTGVPEPEEAGPRAVEAYLTTYGPATPAHLKYWLGSGLGAGKRIGAWIKVLGDRLAEVDVDGTAALVLSDDVEQLANAPTSTAVRLLPAYDPWVLGPGTADPNVVPRAHRGAISRGAHLVVVGGVARGTWSLRDDTVEIDWFDGTGPAPGDRLDEEVSRLGEILDRPLTVAVQTA
jgi:winged helix DNA-binding protein